MQLFENNVIERFSLTSLQNIQISLPTYAFSTLFLKNIENSNVSSLFNLASLRGRNYNNPKLFHKIHNFVKWNYNASKNSSYIVFMWIVFHYFSNKDSIPFQYLFPIFYLKFSSKMIMKSFPGQKGLSLFLSHGLELKTICKLHLTLWINPRKKNEWL